MPSTYSDLKIQLMATGENNTTWGDITNLNLEALEEAIAGSANVTFASANVTLTLTDANTPQTARNLRLRCVGTTGGAPRNLVVPSIEKPYIVRNECADNIVVKTAAGTGVTVPPSSTMWVYSDGTNVVDAVTHLSGLTLGVALPISSGGTGATAAPAARTNLGATTLGSNLFTLANPSAVTFPRFNADNTVSALSAADFRTAIGAGTGTVTSVQVSGGTTGLTATGGPITTSGTITLGGTLGVANGGTGAASITSGRLVKGNGTGAFTASGIVDNSDAVAITIDSSENVGIGTASPSQLLEVASSGSPTIQVTSTNAVTPGIRLARAGASGWGLQVVNTNPDFAIRRLNSDGSVAGNAIHISNGGAVGIGTASPAFPLDVSGSARITGALTLGTDLAVSEGGTGASSASAARTNLGAAASGAVGSSGITMSTARILGRTTGGTGAVEEISIGAGLSLSGGTLSATGGGGSGTVTSVSGTGTVNGLTLSGTVTSSGNLTLGGTLSGVNLSSAVTGTLPVANGGTGATAAPAARTNLGAAASGANTDITSLAQSTAVAATGAAAADSIGYRGLPQNAQGSGYTLVLADQGGHVTITGGVTIPANSSVAFPIGTTIVIYNNSASSQTISITTDTLRLAGTATTGARTIAQRGLCTLVKVGTTEWVATGNVT